MFDIKEEEEARNFVESEMAAHPLFHYYRIVDVNTYMVYKLEAGRLVPQDCRCYQIWKREGACRNCISNLAVNETRQIIKMETLDNKIYLIESLPLPKVGSHYALELIRDVTDSLLIGDTDHQENLALTEIISKMNELATCDIYTGLYNKHYAERELKRQIVEWEETKPFVLVLLDIDRFKAVNDTFGHLTGDKVILAIAEAMKICARQNRGWAGRVGGDEFVLSFGNTGLEEARRLIQELCGMLSKTNFGEAGKPCHIRLSVGIVEYAQEMGDWKTLFDLVDKAMYSDKQLHND